VRVLQREGAVSRVAVIDCDVHQGNGTAAIFSTDPTVYTFSIHGARNYPFRRERSTLDVDLPDGTGDAAYLSALDWHVPNILSDFRPDLVIYLAGADPFENDRYGRLALTKSGLAARDAFVLEECLRRRVPVVITMAGGYGRNPEDTVDIHVATLRIAAAAAAVAPAGPAGHGGGRDPSDLDR
jgi:acetoin utilization deacetylase AcuC-like enzyme